LECSAAGVGAYSESHVHIINQAAHKSLGTTVFPGDPVFLATLHLVFVIILIFLSNVVGVVCNNAVAADDFFPLFRRNGDLRRYAAKAPEIDIWNLDRSSDSIRTAFRDDGQADGAVLQDILSNILDGRQDLCICLVVFSAGNDLILTTLPNLIALYLTPTIHKTWIGIVMLGTILFVITTRPDMMLAVRVKTHLSVVGDRY
jgi:hypothetical protein